MPTIATISPPCRKIKDRGILVVGPPGFEPGSIAPLESIVAGVAREVRGCLARGEGERVDVLLTLLEALGGEPA